MSKCFTLHTLEKTFLPPERQSIRKTARRKGLWNEIKRTSPRLPQATGPMPSLRYTLRRPGVPSEELQPVLQPATNKGLRVEETYRDPS